MNNIQLKTLVYAYLEKWKWFLLSFIIFITLTVLYLLSTEPVYQRKASVLIKDEAESTSPLAAAASSINNRVGMGLFSSKSNVTNELLAMESPAVILEVVRRLHLDMDYSTRKGLREVTLYGKTLPITATIDGLTSDNSAKMTVTVKRNGTFTLSDFKKDKKSFSDEVSGKLGMKVKTPIGHVTIAPTPNFKLEGDEITINVKRHESYDAVEKCTKKLNAEVSDQDGEVLDIIYKDVNIERSIDFINTLINVYKESWLAEKKLVAQNTSNFISDRLITLEQELGQYDDRISTFKSKHMLPDVLETTKMYMKNANSVSGQLVQMNNELYVINYIKNFMKENAGKDKLLPVNMLAENKAIEEQIARYNALLLRRKRLIDLSSSESMFVTDIDDEIKVMHGVILGSLDNAVNQLKIQIKGLQDSKFQNDAQIASAPTQAVQLLSAERQQKVKQELYLFLLQKREEKELSQAFTANNTRLLSPPMGSKKPVTPRKFRLLFLSFIISMLVPAVIIFLREKTNTTIRTRKGLDDIGIPFLGQTPLMKKSKKQAADDDRHIIVQPNNTDATNEAFRIIRTNLEFAVPNKQSGNVIQITSADAKSGKTFVCANLASALAINKKKSIAIDLDLRKTTLSQYVDNPQKGLSDYLAGRTNNWKELICHAKESSLLDIIPVGAIPQNPTELLANGTINTLLDELRKEYDFILLDSTSMEIVADTAIVAPLSDATIFVLRGGQTDYSVLATINHYKNEGRLSNIMTLLNSVDLQKQA